MRLSSFAPGAAAACLLAFLSPDARAGDEPSHAHVTPAGTASATILEAWGRIIARESDAAAFGLTETECAAFVRGLDLGARQQPAPHDLDKIYSDVTQFVETHRTAVRAAQRKQNLAAAPAYFAALAARPGVTVLPSGLAYEILSPGAGPRPSLSDTATVRYEARLADGTEFDSTAQMGPVDVALDRIVPGWAEGLRLIGVGGKIRLHLPPALSFNDDDALKLGIPPASIVVSELELLAIKPTPPSEPPPPSAPVPPPPPPAGFTPGQILETWGWIVAQERGVLPARLGAGELAAVERGLADALAGRPARFDEKALYPEVAHFVAGRQEAFREAVRQKRRDETAAFFATLSARPGVARRPDGLCYEIVQPGAGTPPRADQRVRVNYVGRLIDGTVFDRTDPALGPLDVDLAGVMKGWREGLPLIAPGGVIRLYLPPELAYGDTATGGIPAGSALCFEIELLEVRDVPADAPPSDPSAP